MKILVDADACPVKEIIVTQARTRRIPVIMVIDTSHEWQDGYSRVITVDRAKDSADIALMNLTEPGDLVVTQDYGVAAMALGRGAFALHQSGMRYTGENMDRLLFERHLGGKIRRAGGRTKGPKKRSGADDEAFAAALEIILSEAAGEKA